MFRLLTILDRRPRCAARRRPLCPRRSPPARRLVLEALEERTLLSYSFTLIADTSGALGDLSRFTPSLNSEGVWLRTIREWGVSSSFSCVIMGVVGCQRRKPGESHEPPGYAKRTASPCAWP